MSGPGGDRRLRHAALHANDGVGVRAQIRRRRAPWVPLWLWVEPEPLFRIPAKSWPLILQGHGGPKARLRITSFFKGQGANVSLIFEDIIPWRLASSELDSMETLLTVTDCHA